MRRLVTILAGVCLLAMLTPAPVRAWFGNLTCPAYGACRWANNVAGPFRIASVSFPSGSDSWWRLIDAINQHDGYPGSALTVTYLNDASLQVGDTISHTDGLSHVIWSDIASVGGTTCKYDGAFHMTECDVMFDPYATDWGTSVPSRDVLYDGDAFDAFTEPYYKSLMSAAAHELGHAMGLGHPLFGALDQSYSLSTMAKADRWPYPDLYPVVPLRPDDGAGLRALYPGSGEPINVSIAHYYPDYADLEPGWGYYIESKYEDLHSGGKAPYAEYGQACPGDTIDVTKTLMNSGTQTADRVDMGYYLTADPTIDPTLGTLIERHRFTLGGQDWMRNTVNLTLPWAPAGTYYVVGQIDPDATYEAANRTDNDLVFGTIEMQGTGFGQPCGPEITGKTLYKGGFTLHTPRVSLAKTFRASSGVYDVTITGMSVAQATDTKPPQQGMPYTFYTATVNSTLFGPARATLSIRQPGGAVTASGIVQWGVIASEARRLDVGRRYIVFRGSDDDNAFATGGGESILRVTTSGGATQVTTFEGFPLVGFDRATNTFAVRPDYLAFLRSSTFIETEDDGKNASRPVNLSALDAAPMTLAAVKAALAEVRAEGGFTPLPFQARPMTSFARVAPRPEVR